MITTFKHKLTSSFLLWLDHTLTNEGQAYTNYGSQLYPINDPPWANYSVYSTPFGQFVYDSSVSGASVISGVTVNGQFRTRGYNNLQIDYEHGRVLMNKGVPMVVSGNYAFKEFDIQYTTTPEEELIISPKLSIKPSYITGPTGLLSSQIPVPAIFVSKMNSSNDGYQLGAGADQSTTYYRALIVGTSDWQLDGIDAIFTPKKATYFKVLDGTPWNEFGDLKNGVYSYQAECDKITDPARLAFLKAVDFTKFTSTTNAAINPLLNLGVLEFTVEMVQI